MKKSVVNGYTFFFAWSQHFIRIGSPVTHWYWNVNNKNRTEWWKKEKNQVLSGIVESFITADT